MKIKGKSMTALLALAIVALMPVQGDAAANLALGASYEYATNYPGMPDFTHGTNETEKTANSLAWLTDGVVTNTNPTNDLALVVEVGGQFLLVHNIDLGQDYDIGGLKGLAEESVWDNNDVGSFEFYVRTEADGPFDIDIISVTGLKSAATQFTPSVPVDKTNPIWEADAGEIGVRGRYVTVIARRADGETGNIGVSEIQILAFEPSTNNYALLADYEYAPISPAFPGHTPSETNNAVMLTDGLVGSTNSDSWLVVEHGVQFLLAHNIDLGQDRKIGGLKGLSHESYWGNNDIGYMEFYVRTEAQGPFDPTTISKPILQSAALWYSPDITVDKTGGDTDWVMDTGEISVEGRYLTVIARRAAGETGNIGLGEVQVIPFQPSENVALLSDYEYAPVWPGFPDHVSLKETNTFMLTDGLVGTTNSDAQLVVEDGGQFLLAHNIDFGQDHDLIRLKGLTRESVYGNNAISTMEFYVRTEAQGPFDPNTTSKLTLQTDSSWYSPDISVDKTGGVNDWVMDTGEIAVTGRYLTIIARDDDSGGNIGLAEVQAFIQGEVIEATILSLTPVGGGIMEMVVSTPSDAERYYPVAETDLAAAGPWTNRVLHSDNGMNTYYTTNLSYSSGVSNEVIYVQSTEAAKFFKIIAE